MAACTRQIQLKNNARRTSAAGIQLVKKTFLLTYLLSAFAILLSADFLYSKAVDISVDTVDNALNFALPNHHTARIYIL